ncbi:hypothetical protein D4764_14G0011220 [Takifugu flavidus]|uniref:Uncharacterized protein n=1 Tax=Takifugu flavidus TaxID=433684 RepID=A0A5C6P864_9TELE|nr:hypothetical protein D4764_14G0011220 [Takifugu flavidus]
MKATSSLPDGSNSKGNHSLDGSK